MGYAVLAKLNKSAKNPPIRRMIFKKLRQKRCIVDNLLITQKSFQQPKNRQNFQKSDKPA